ncbi:hypothetical protein KSS87_006036 [Heliosperma pusillum]|nr:hypothetical protein KSS87_006036 [Heliosperma pusillum]
MDKLYKCDANYTPLTPITFLKRASMFYADRTSIIYGEARFTWRQTYLRCRRLASSLVSLGVSVLAPNIPAMYEMHFAVPMAGAILNTINSMLDANSIKTILFHSEAKMVFVDHEYVSKACDALTLLKNDPNCAKNRNFKLPSVIIINEIGYPPYNNELGSGVRDFVNESSIPFSNIDYHPLNLKNSNKLDYEQLILLGNPEFIEPKIVDEWDPIALNYTSGTTSAPKGVVYSHRGAYLSTLSMILGWEMETEPVYLWSLPMFHCNGWTFTWGIAARGGTNVCIRKTTASEIYNSIALHGVTHMCCAPIVFNMIREAKHVELRSRVQVLTGGAPPPATLLEEMEGLGFDVVHAFGLTEATGPALVCEWQTKWDDLPREDKSRLKARQGISVLTVEDMDVKDLKSKESVARDGKSRGEIVIRGSGIMKGYFKDEKATSKAFEDGWFHTGDVGVIHPDGYVEIKDRLKDVIISGGENISSVEVEGVIFRHSEVAEVAVVAMPHPRWGESPCAFVVKKSPSKNVTEQEIVAHCRSNLTHYMVPKKVVFVKDLPKTSTGKVQKPILRAIAKNFEVQSSKDQNQTIPMSRL